MRDSPTLEAAGRDDLLRAWSTFASVPSRIPPIHLEALCGLRSTSLAVTSGRGAIRVLLIYVAVGGRSAASSTWRIS
jgi:hypothetical protein